MLKVLMPSLKYIVDNEYAFVKTKETECIINTLLKGLKSESSPVLLQVSGIPGAGKSTYCQKYKQDNFLYLSFDNIMLLLKDYQSDVVFLGSEEAFKRHEMKARIIGYELLSRALSMRLNIMFEHSGTNAHVELFKNIPNYGYKTMVNFITCNIESAIRRAKIRGEETKRYTPEKLIIERAEKFDYYVKEYQKIVTEIKILDGVNNFSSLKEI